MLHQEKSKLMLLYVLTLPRGNYVFTFVGFVCMQVYWHIWEQILMRFLEGLGMMKRT